VDHNQMRYSRSNLCSLTHPQSGCNAFLSNLWFRSVTRVFHSLFSDVTLQEDWPSHLHVYFLNTAIILPTHSCHSCVGEVARLKQKLKDLRNRLAQHWQVPRYPTCMRKHSLTCCLSMIQKWSDIYVPIFPTI